MSDQQRGKAASAWAIAKRVYEMNGLYNLSLLAAGVAFFSFLSFVPLIASTVLIYGLVADPQMVAQSISLLDGIAPPEVLTILQEQLIAIVTSSRTAQGFGLLLAILLAVYGAMRSANAMISALNIIHEQRETRGFLRTTGIAAGITLGMVLVAMVGVTAISIFTLVTTFLAPWLGSGATLLLQWATWLCAGMLISLTFAIFFRFAPDVEAARWRWLSLGSVLATLLWIGITFGFAFYVANFGNYNATYGSLATIVIFLMWLFLSAYSVLIGALVNRAIADAAPVNGAAA